MVQHDMEKMSKQSEATGDCGLRKRKRSDSQFLGQSPTPGLVYQSASHHIKFGSRIILGTNKTSRPTGAGNSDEDIPIQKRTCIFNREYPEHKRVRKHFRHLFKGKDKRKPRPSPLPHGYESGSLEELRRYRQEQAKKCEKVLGQAIHSKSWIVAKARADQMCRGQSAAVKDSVKAILQTCLAGPEEWRLIALMKSKLKRHRNFEMRTRIKGVSELDGHPWAAVHRLLVLLSAGCNGQIPGCAIEDSGESEQALGWLNDLEEVQYSPKAHTYSPRLLAVTFRKFLSSMKQFENPRRIILENMAKIQQSEEHSSETSA